MRKRVCRLRGVDEMVICLVARGMSTGDVQAHLAEVYGTNVSRQQVSTITDAVVDKMTEWAIYPVVFIGAIHVKVRDGQVTNRPIYVALAVTCDGERDVLGLWAGEHGEGEGEGAKYWMKVLTEIKNRGTGDVCIVVCDGLQGLPEAITTVWDRAIVHTCVIRVLRNTFRYASRTYWDEMSRDLRPIYTAANEAAARERFDEFAGRWGPQYPAIVGLWQSAWNDFVPFLDYGVEIRRVICSTNAIETSRSTPGTGAPSAPVGTSRPIRPPSHACIWLPGHWTRPAKANHDGQSGGSRR